MRTKKIFNYLIKGILAFVIFVSISPAKSVLAHSYNCNNYNNYNYSYKETICVYKSWSGQPLKYGEKRPDVYFQLLKDGRPVGEPKKAVKNKASFTISSFRDIYRYTIKEVNADGSDWSAEGYRAGSVRRDSCNPCVFYITNIKERTETICVYKSWSGQPLKYGEKRPDVYFQLLKDGRPVGEPKKAVKNKASFTISSFRDIYRYTIKEVNVDGSDWSAEGYRAGIVYRSSYNPCVFCVTNNKDKMPAPGEVTVDKIWTGVDLEVGQNYPDVYFQLLKDGHAVGSPVLYEGHTVTFKIDNKDEISKYVVKEVNADGSDWSAEGYVPGTIEGSDGVFTVENRKLGPKPASASIVLRKTMLGRPIKDGEFSFQLINDQGVVIETITNLGNDICFSEIEYTKAGTYRYTVVEQEGDNKNIIYDAKVIEVIVEVKDVEGQLVAEVSYSPGNEFNNQLKEKHVKVIKIDENYDYLVGATLQMTSDNGYNEVWVTNGKGRTFELTEGRYTITELSTPNEEYELASPVVFDIVYNEAKEELEFVIVDEGEGNIINEVENIIYMLDKFKIIIN
ncbi:Spy0128 family protein [Enterococcus faecalis]|uniref:Spy0128 family protein n=1 Tax=Enterococcus faecalis TaxID=1351 RepID=UPI0021E8D08C|nr:FctA domain-containing protein [Enterococcus faecalis]MCV3151299.1 Cna B-type domain-containing protein [Enterococcus faecalis]MCV3172711.1 Cna B-type domain-containing protein [Enterococcus faecalis]